MRARVRVIAKCIEHVIAPHTHIGHNMRSEADITKCFTTIARTEIVAAACGEALCVVKILELGSAAVRDVVLDLSVLRPVVHDLRRDSPLPPLRWQGGLVTVLFRRGLHGIKEGEWRKGKE